MRTFWLSFVDDTQPEGERFAGAAVVEVTDAEVAAIRPELALRFPQAQEGADAIAAATRKAHTLGCNPGGQVRAWEIPPEALADVQLAPRGQLLSRGELIALGLV